MKTYFTCIAQFTVLALVVVTSVATPAKAQTIISNETLVTTAFVVNKTAATAKCKAVGCSANVPMLSSIPVTCPAAMGKTCTFHIQLDSKVETSFPCQNGCFGPGPKTSFQFLVDGSSPVPGPVEGNGYYLFGENVSTYAEETSESFLERQNYPASIVSTVTNTNSTNHTIDVGVACSDTSKFGGCEAVAHFSTMRIDVFEP